MLANDTSPSRPGTDALERGVDSRRAHRRLAQDAPGRAPRLGRAPPRPLPHVAIALAAIACLATPTQPARGQASVAVTGDVGPFGWTSPDWAAPGILAVGGYTGSGYGTLTVTDGGTVRSGTGYIGALSGSEGIVTITGAGSDWTNTGTLNVGLFGKGTLIVANGGTVSNTQGAIATFSDSPSIATVTGAGSDWTNSGSLTVGGFGDGTLVIADGARVGAAFVILGSGSGTLGLLGAAGGRGVLETGYLTNGGGAARLDLDGGILRATRDEGDFLRNLGALAAGSQGIWIDSNGHDIAVGPSTTFSGSSSFNKIGAGTLALTGDSSGFAGETRIDGGTLAIAQGGRLGGSLGEIGSGAVTVTGDASAWISTGGLTVGGPGNGALTVADGGTVGAAFVILGGTGTLDLVGSAASGRGVLETGHVAGGGAATLDLDGGILRAIHDEGDFLRDFGTLAAGSRGIWIDSNGHDIAVGPSTTFSGSSSFNKIGAGTLTLAGDSGGFAGTTTVSGGALLVGGAAGTGRLGGTLNVEAGGLLGGIGTVGSAGAAVTVAAGAVHAPGNSIGVQAIAGDYANHGTLRIEATPGGADRIVVAGAVDITGASLELLLSPVSASDWDVLTGPFTIIDKQGAGPVTGTFVDPVTKNLIFLDAILDYAGGDGNDVTVRLERNDVAFAQAGLTRNQIAVGAAVDTLGHASPVWRSIALTGNIDAARASFDALSGEIHASARTALIEDSRFIRDAANDRLRGSFDGTADRPVAWVRAFGSRGHARGDGNAAGLDRSGGGVVAGVDAALSDTWRLGALAGYGRTAFGVGERFSSGSSDSRHLGLYGGGRWGSLGVRAGLAYSRHAVDTRRRVFIPGLADAPKGDYGAGTFQLFGEIDYGIDVGAARLAPFANLAHVRLHTDGFTETGGAAALSVAGGRADATFATLGLRGSATVGAGLTAKGMLGWRHGFGHAAPEATMRLAAGGAGFTIAGAAIARDAMVVEAGLGLALSPTATFGIAYDGRFGGGGEQSFRAGLDVRF